MEALPPSAHDEQGGVVVEEPDPKRIRLDDATATEMPVKSGDLQAEASSSNPVVKVFDYEKFVEPPEQVQQAFYQRFCFLDPQRAEGLGQGHTMAHDPCRACGWFQRSFVQRLTSIRSGGETGRPSQDSGYESLLQEQEGGIPMDAFQVQSTHSLSWRRRPRHYHLATRRTNFDQIGFDIFDGASAISSIDGG